MRRFIISILLTLTGLSLSSCLYIGPSVSGNGKVKEVTREVGDFRGVSVTSGMNVHLIQGDQPKVVVVADENLHEYIETIVENGILEIKTTARIWKTKEKKVMVTIPHLTEISGTAGSNLYADNLLEADELSIRGSAGSNIHLSLAGQKVDVSASSGSNIFLEGTSRELTIKTSSGANIKAGQIKTDKCSVTASSGGNVWILVLSELSAKASSGGNIFYSGSPDLLNVTSSSGGNIIKK